MKTEQNQIRNKDWRLGDIVSLWYLKHNVPCRIIRIIEKDIKPEEIVPTSRDIDFGEAKGKNVYRGKQRYKNVKSSIQKNGFNSKIFCVKHTTNPELNANFIEGNLLDTRIIDGHNRWLAARDIGITFIPCKIFVLEFVNMDVSKKIKELNKSNNPWVHSINLGNGIVTPGTYHQGSASAEKKWEYCELDFNNKSVLDLGCADGWFSIKVKQNGASSITGIDNEPIRLERAKFCAKVLGLDIDFRQNDLNKELTYRPDNSVDIILALAVTHHVDDANQLIEDIERILKPNGVCILENRGNADYNIGKNGKKYNQGWVLSDVAEKFSFTTLLNNFEWRGQEVRAFYRLIK